MSMRVRELQQYLSKFTDAARIVFKTESIQRWKSPTYKQS
mgnify:CR=1 FL=1